MLPYFDAQTWTEAFHCHFDTQWHFVAGYLILAFQALVAFLVVFVLKRDPETHSALADFLLAAEELMVIVLVVAGLCFGFYRDLIYVAVACYVLLLKYRVPFDNTF